LDKILQTGVDYGDMVKIEDVEFQYGGRLGEFHGMSSHSHLPHCRVQSPDEISVMIVPHCSCNNSIRHIENRFSPYFIFFCFLMQLGFDERRLSYRLR